MILHLEHILSVLPIILIGGSVFGLGMAVLMLYLNTKTVYSLRSSVMLTIYLVAFYTALWALPLIVMTGILEFLPGGISLRFSAMSLMLIALGLILFGNIAFYKTLCYSPATKVMRAYVVAVFLFALAASLCVLTKSYCNVFLISGGVLFVFVSIAAIVSFAFITPRLKKESDAGEIEKADKQKQKLLWFGIDSATWEILDPLVSAGRLPNIKKLMDAGSYGPLKSFVPTHSPIIWTSKSTGKLPSKHGVRDFLILKIKGVKEQIELIPLEPILRKFVSFSARLRFVARRPVSSSDRKALSIWNILPFFGYKVAVISWFVTDPAEKINGLMVPEFFYITSDERGGRASPVHPKELNEELHKVRDAIDARVRDESENDKIKKTFNIVGDLTPKQKRKFEILKVFYFHDQLRHEVIKYVFNNCPDIDVFITYLHGVDAMQHHFWAAHHKQEGPFKDVVNIYHEIVDKMIGEVLEMIGESRSVLITSDHGHESLDPIKKVYNILNGNEQITGTHSSGPDGVIIASGVDIKKGVDVVDMGVNDVFPTILRLLDLPVGEDMDGVVYENIIDGKRTPKTIPSYENRLDVDSAEAKDMTEDPEMLQRLRDLGYID